MAYTKKRRKNDPSYKKTRRNSTGLTKADRTIEYVLDPAQSFEGGNNYFADIGQSLSLTNRKLFSQTKVYGIESVEFLFQANPATYDSISLFAFIAPDNWVLQNAHTKGHALWTEMNQLVLEDNPSVEGKWADYKVFLNPAHRNANLAVGYVGNLIPTVTSVPGALGANEYLQGEWNYSDYVMPQHDVDPATGNPLPADVTNCHLIGDDISFVNPDFSINYQSVGLIKAYAESRARVNIDQPNMPTGFENSFFNRLTDSGLQEPELGAVIIDENDNPPYDRDNYPGGDLNVPGPVLAEFASASPGFPNGMMTSFVAPCGLIQFSAIAYKDGVGVAAPPILAKVTVMAGTYKGVAAIDMGQ